MAIVIIDDASTMHNDELQDTNVVLAISRIMVAWQPVGLAMGVYDMTNRYLRQREQFGNPLAAYQVGHLIQASVAFLDFGMAAAAKFPQCAAL